MTIRISGGSRKIGLTLVIYAACRIDLVAITENEQITEHKKCRSFTYMKQF